MGKVKVLDQLVADMIAAGEVVERPYSVVKELVENSIDAGATLITIEITNGGTSFIRVTDNGSGIQKEDAIIAFSRHATSKIQTATDLTAINTLGFRGEALSSIAAVSKIELITKSINEDVGTKVLIEGGNLIETSDIGCPNGTTIIVRNLFFNTPARMKFLKKDQTEASYISEIVDRLILSHPEISFRLIINGKEAIYSAGDNSILSCVYTVFGKEYAKQMNKLLRKEDGVEITGLVGNNTISRGNRNFEVFFVNGRYVKSRLLTSAFEAAYNEKLSKGRYPIGVINIKINPSLIDINVHPTKMEVKFSDDKKIYSAIYWAVCDSLSKNEATFEVKTTPKDIFKYQNENISYTQNTLTNISPIQKNETINPFKKDEKPFETTFAVSEQKSDFYINDKKTEIIETIDESFKIIGQLFDTYILIEKGNDLLLIDQHAAHERLKYEELILKNENKNGFSQMLLAPIILNLSKTEIVTVLQNLQLFENLGFNLEEFGNNSIIIRQVPVILNEEAIKELVLELIETINGYKNSSFTDTTKKAFYQIACKSAIRANKKLSLVEMEKLFSDIMKIKDLNTCPHGRPIIISFSKYYIEKQFKRV